MLIGAVIILLLCQAVFVNATNTIPFIVVRVLPFILALLLIKEFYL